MSRGTFEWKRFAVISIQLPLNVLRTSFTVFASLLMSVSLLEGEQQLPFIPLFCDQVADQRLHQFTETWRVSTVIIITFSIVSIISITLLLMFHHCLSSKSGLESVFKPLWKSSSAFQMHLPQQVSGWRSEAEVFCPGGTATSNSNTLCVRLQKCTWKGFCFSKNAHVLSDQTRLLMFPCVQSSWTSEPRTYLLWTVSS